MRVKNVYPRILGIFRCGGLHGENKLKTPIVAAMNHKGGVGKTLTTTLLAEWFSIIKNKKVLLIDLDMQCNTTDQWVGMVKDDSVTGGQTPPVHPDYTEDLEANPCSTIADIFYGKYVLPYPTWVNDIPGNTGLVEVICGHPKLLEDINNEFSRSDDRIDKQVHNRIKEFLHDETVQSGYDLILLDTGPSRNPIFRAAMRAASHIIIPFKPESKDIQGIASMLQIFRQEVYSRPSNAHKIELIGMLPNMVRRTKLHEQNLTLLENVHGNILFPPEAWLFNLTAFPERDMKNNRPRSIFEMSEDSQARQQATSMASFVENKILPFSEENPECLGKIG